MRAVVYARYSSSKQTEQSIEGQLRDCYTYAKNNDIVVVGEYIDRAISAKTDHRPEFQRMVKDSVSRSFDAVIVWKLDRFSRNRYDSASYKVKLKKNGVRVISAMENISDKPEGILVESLLEGMAEYYSAELSQKVSRGMRESALKCQSNGSFAPLGYKVDENKKYVLVESEALIVRKIFEMYADGIKPKNIIDYLNEHGYKTKRGGSFNKNSLNKMLKNKKYIGVYKYKDIEIPNGVPRIISDELFNKVQNIIDKNRRTGATYKTKVDYLLSGKLYCGCCHEKMLGESGTGRHGAVYYYYKCFGRKSRKKDCDKKSVPKDVVEDLVIKSIESILYNPDLIKRIAKKCVELQNDAEANKMFELIQTQLKDTKKKIANITSAIENGAYSEALKNRLNELENTQSTLEYELSIERAKNPIFTYETIEAMLNNLSKGNMHDDHFKHYLIDIFVYRIYMYYDKMIIIYNFTKDDNRTRKSEVIEKIEDVSDTIFNGSPVRYLYRTISSIEIFFCIK